MATKEKTLLQDTDKPLSMQDVMNLMKQKEDFDNKNEASLNVKVVEKHVYPLEPKMRMTKDEKGNLIPELDEHGNEKYYPQTHSITAIFAGGEANINVKPEWNLQLNERVVLQGRLGTFKSFGRDQFGFIPSGVLRWELPSL